jgi:hypothetical protein
MACFGQEDTETKNPLMVFLPISYDGLWLEDQAIHSPTGGIDFIWGKHDLPF